MKDNYSKKLDSIDFFRKGKHPEYKPFVGKNYEKYRVLHIGESHYIDNKDDNPTITLDDFKGWWDGEQSEKLNELISWYNTASVVNDYMDYRRTKAHGIFTNVLKSFCNVVIPNDSFDKITTEDSKKYNYFAYMNFYQMPSIYFDKNYTKALYSAGKIEGMNNDQIDKLWYECFDNSVKIFENVVEEIEPKIIIVSSMEVCKYYEKYALIDESGKRGKGKLFKDSRVIFVDHPGTSWWNRVKKDNALLTSKQRLENKLKEIYI